MTHSPYSFASLINEEERNETSVADLITEEYFNDNRVVGYMLNTQVLFDRYPVVTVVPELMVPELMVPERCKEDVVPTYRKTIYLPMIFYGKSHTFDTRSSITRELRYVVIPQARFMVQAPESQVFTYTFEAYDQVLIMSCEALRINDIVETKHYIFRLPYIVVGSSYDDWTKEEVTVDIMAPTDYTKFTDRDTYSIGKSLVTPPIDDCLSVLRTVAIKPFSVLLTSGEIL